MTDTGGEGRGQGERRGGGWWPALVLFAAAAVFFGWGSTRGWGSGRLPGNEYRQTHTAMTALFVQRDRDFSLAYPTPLLGPPWSVPYEFPLYQWAAVAVSDRTGMPLIQAGRAVSWLCFVLALPAVWLLLGRIGVDARGRLVVLAVLLTCPLYVFYARAFLIETMALMLALWFLLAFVTALERRSAPWLLLANAAGVGAGLVKVTTFLIYLLAAAAWMLVRMRADARAAGGGTAGARRALVRLAPWAAGAVLLPLVAAWGWTAYADSIKALNPGARQLMASAMHSYHFGTWEVRMSGEVWASHGRAIVTHLASVPVLVMAGLVAVAWGGRWRAWIAGCAAMFAAGPLVFPVLYSWHEYYFAANGVWLAAAIGLALVALREGAATRRVAWLAVAAVLAVQGGLYGQRLLPIQRVPGSGGTGLTDLLRDATEPRDVLVIAGEDWAPMIPFRAERRALMFRHQRDREHGRYVTEALAQLRGEPVAALLLSNDARDNRELCRQMAADFGLETEPALTWQNRVDVYVRPEMRERLARQLRAAAYGEVELTERARALEPPERTAPPVRDVDERQRELFARMQPGPLRYAADHPPALVELGGETLLMVHPRCRLWFAVPAGRKQLTLEFGILPGAHEGLPPNQATDGVEFSAWLTPTGGAPRDVFRRLLRPETTPADRGRQTASIEIVTEGGGELLIETGPGPAGAMNRDWAYLGQVRIR